MQAYEQKSKKMHDSSHAQIHACVGKAGSVVKST